MARLIFLTLGTLALLLGGCQAVDPGSSRWEGTGTIFALIGVGFMIAAVAMAIIEPKDETPDASGGGARLRDDQEEQEPGS
ncbi:hypothetical protein ACFOWE_23060 [Planomonospora corallina]|uniref:Lipoprotein n=1 Tax=Planomonospora corallina TaxID=1806052 RepID=A0ABV8IBC0_9ACTN